MGLTKNSVGTKVLSARRKKGGEKIIALAGNPNVGKSTLFNGLTGMNQHTGNWPGKTVANATGICKSDKYTYQFVDIPGTYSLMSHSKEEEIARNFICFEKNDTVVVVCDATCLERNLNLVLQIIEISNKVLVCVNLMDEAERKGIKVNIKKLEKILGVPVVSTVAKSKKSVKKFLSTLDAVCDGNFNGEKYKITYSEDTETKIKGIEKSLEKTDTKGVNKRWLALKLLEGDKTLLREIEDFLGIKTNVEYNEAVKDEIVTKIVKSAEEVSKQVLSCRKGKYADFDKKADRLLTGKKVGFPVMIALLFVVFWLTVTGANYPSEILSDFFAFLQGYLLRILTALKLPEWVIDLLVSGVYNTLTGIVAVMLPPMAIFFPLFTLLEDLGYLPRIAYNLDRPFKKCNACGKQALTMCMGFGCNAAGVVGCRIIDSKRERLLALLTNSFVPCNGRFPTLIAIISMFFLSGVLDSVVSSALLTLCILLGVAMTFWVTKLLSGTVLKGEPTSYVLELPPYRKPQIGTVIVRSIFDRTLFVLGRAVVVAAPAGLVIWCAANLELNGVSILGHVASFLNPFARLMGLDGIILIAFILGFPANEIVLPVIIMAYTAGGSLGEAENLSYMRELFVANGWTWVTAVNMLLFTLFHWPCSTTLITVKKETGSIKWTFLAFLLPTVTGIICCMGFTATVKLILLIFN